MTVGWFRAAATSLVAVSVMVGVAQAQAIRIDIPAGDLGPALTAFARASGLQILADPSMTDGLKTRGVSGEMAPREALEALFAGTGLGFELHGDAVIVRGTAPAPAEPAAPAPTRMKPEAAAAPAGEAMEELTITGYRVRATAGGTRIVTPLKDLPMSVQVVNQELIKDLGARKIEDAIRFVSGINKVNRNDNLGRGERFAIRGFNSSLIMRNGVPYNVFSDTANIQQIDVVKGANSILYGFNDPGGLINYITRAPQAEAAYSVSQTIGSFDYYRTEADATGPLFGDTRYRLMAAYTNAGSHLENGKEEMVFINPVVDFALGEKTRLLLDYEYRETDSRYQRDAYPQVRDLAGVGIRYADAGTRYSPIFPDDRNIITAQNLELRLTHEVGEDTTLRLVGAHTEIDSDQFNMIGWAMVPGSDRLLERRNYLELNHQDTDFVFADLSTRFDTRWMTHQVILGGQYLRREGESFGRTGAYAPAIDVLNPPTDPAVRYYRPETRDQLAAGAVFVESAPTESKGFFVTDQITLADDRTHILVGARYDDLNGTDNTTPQAGVNYTVNDWLSVYGLYSESFRLNASYTLQSGEVRTFDPESGINKEIGLKLDLFDRRLSGTVALFNLTRENVLQVIASDDPLKPIFNLSGEERSKGVEIDIAGRIGPDFTVFASYAYTDSEVLTSTNPALVGAPLEGVAKNAVSVFGKYDFGAVGPGDLSANAGLLWRQGPILMTNNTPGNTPFAADSYTVLDAGLDYVLPSGLALSLKVTNLTDEAYMDRRAAYAAPRRINLVVRKEF